MLDDSEPSAFEIDLEYQWALIKAIFIAEAVKTKIVMRKILFSIKLIPKDSDDSKIIVRSKQFFCNLQTLENQEHAKTSHILF